ncbi:MAG: hypothetical protein H6810_07180 [Phycisphaeraceae bacterium]|nr:MAG: hypothetical protein H6810_07180 [Phycisphaeraceae bacterium]
MPGMPYLVRCPVILIALAAAPAFAEGPKAELPTRIPMNEKYGGSKFAEALHDLSESGALDPPPPPPADADHQQQRDQGHWHGYRGYTYYGYGSRGNTYYWNPYDDYRYPYPYGVDGRVRYGTQPGSQMTAPASTTPAATQQAAPAEPPTEIELARAALAYGDDEGAIQHYRTHLTENPDDFRAAAELAVALLAAGRDDDGVAMIRLAYGSDPGLAIRPISERVLLNSRQWRDLVVRAVRHAHQRDSGSAWLTVSVLMQAEGRTKVAMRMLDRARDRGLDRSVFDPLAATMR